jgi:phage tail sheath protein FI
MAQNISPGVYVIEKDISQYIAGEATSIVGVVGFANKGPINTPTLVTSREQLIQTFGEPSQDIPSQAIEAGLEIMEVGNQLYFVRAAVENLTADAEALVQFGACPAVQLSSNNYGVSQSVYLKVQVTDNIAAEKFTEPKLFSIPSGIATTQSSALLSVIGGAADQDYVSYEFVNNQHCIIGMFPGQNATISVSAYSDAACTTPIPSALSPIFYASAAAPVLNLPGIINSTSSVSSTTSTFITLGGAASMNLSSVISGTQTTGTIECTAGTYTLATLRSAINTMIPSSTAKVSFNFKYDSQTGNYVPIIFTAVSANTANLHVHNSYVSGAYLGTSAGLAVSGPLASAIGLTANSTTTTSVSGSTNSTYYFYSSSMTAVGATVSGTSLSYKVASLYPGTGYNATTNTDGTYSGNSVVINLAAKDKSVLVITDGGVTAESFKVGLDESSFYESVINTGLTNPVSEYVKANLVTGANYDTDFDAVALTQGFTEPLSAIGLDASAIYYTLGGFETAQHPYNYLQNNEVYPLRFTSGNGVTTATEPNSQVLFNKLVNSTYNLANGTNGYSTSDQTVNDQALIGTTGESVNTGIYALDRDYFNISIAIVPGVNTQDVQNALINLAETSQNFLALVSPPYGSINTVQQAIDWSNGRAETRTSPINNSFAAVYWPWVKVFSVYDGTDRWYDPVIFAARQMCFTDLVSEPWFAPAGFTRGNLAKPKDVEVELTQGDRDSMYSGGNIINPIVKFPSAGITIFGQRTAKRTPSALDRINVRRLMIYLRKIIINGTQSLVFEPNDPFTWAAVKNLIEPTLNDIKNRRGLLDYSVVCDESTNTPARIERGELWCKVVVRPTKSSETITFELNVTNQSAKIG